MAVHHTIERLRVEGDEIGVDVKGFAFNDEFEGDGSVDTARNIRERLNRTGGDRYLLLWSDMMSSSSDSQSGHWV